MIGKNYIFLAGKETGRKKNPKNDRMMSRQIRQLAGQLLNCCPVYSTSFQLCRSLWRLISLRILDSCFKSHPSCQLFRPLRVFLETLDNLPLEGTIVIDLNLSGCPVRRRWWLSRAIASQKASHKVSPPIFIFQKESLFSNLAGP